MFQLSLNNQIDSCHCAIQRNLFTLEDCLRRSTCWRRSGYFIVVAHPYVSITVLYHATLPISKQTRICLSVTFTFFFQCFYLFLRRPRSIAKATAAACRNLHPRISSHTGLFPILQIWFHWSWKRISIHPHSTDSTSFEEKAQTKNHNQYKTILHFSGPNKQNIFTYQWTFKSKKLAATKDITSSRYFLWTSSFLANKNRVELKLVSLNN